MDGTLCRCGGDERVERALLYRRGLVESAVFMEKGDLRQTRANPVSPSRAEKKKKETKKIFATTLHPHTQRKFHLKIPIPTEGCVCLFPQSD